MECKIENLSALASSEKSGAKKRNFLSIVLLAVLYQVDTLIVFKSLNRLAAKTLDSALVKKIASNEKAFIILSIKRVNLGFLTSFFSLFRLFVLSFLFLWNFLHFYLIQPFLYILPVKNFFKKDKPIELLSKELALDLILHIFKSSSESIKKSKQFLEMVKTDLVGMLLHNIFEKVSNVSAYFLFLAINRFLLFFTFILDINFINQLIIQFKYFNTFLTFN